MVGAIRFITNDNCKVFIYPVGTHSQIDWDTEHPSDLGNGFVTYDAKSDYEQPGAITIAKGLDGEYVLRLVETKRYMLRMECKKGDHISLPHFQNQGNKFLKCYKDKDSLSFQFINYLGRSRLYFGITEDGDTLTFEVVPDKMNYEDDYIGLTEALAEFCSSMLLEHTGATSNVYSQSGEDQKSLLEQFIFLRQFCYSQNLQMLFEAVKRNPDRVLEKSVEYRPLGMGRPSNKFYTSPFSYSKNWVKLKSASGQLKYLPQEVAVDRKYDNLDTPANRFIKFALHKFDNVCVALTEKLDKAGQAKQAECYEEAKSIHNQLDDIFRDSFFDDLGDLDIMPQNNQVLQKREGYSQVFSAFSMLDLALQLDWKGKDDVYEGESKNVALLYEYWLFFELYKIIKSIDGCETLKTEESPFLTDDKNGLTISLVQGEKSCQSFVIRNLGVKINLYYNRTFKWAEFKTTKYEGSYSRPFRPDYTLAIFPDTYNKGGSNGEDEAIKCGAVSYVHFDAKYRITDLTALIGKKLEDSDMEKELEEDKSGSVVNTYKRGDLLKMHTYNDAIRRTVGSYVLYPGSYDTMNKDENRFELYDEILPGVGAFAIKPGNAAQDESALKSFILELIESRASDNTRLYRMNHYTETVIKEPKITTINEEPDKTYFDNTPPAKGNNGLIDVQNDKLCAVGYIRDGNENDYYHFLKEKGLLSNGSKFLFYFYAIKDKQVYSHHKDIFNASYFRFYKNRISDNDTYILEPVLCSVISDKNELVSKADLVKKLKETGYETAEQRHHADFYYVLKVRVINDNYKTDEFKTSFINSKNGNDTFSPHTPKVMLMSDLAGSDQQ